MKLIEARIQTLETRATSSSLEVYVAAMISCGGEHNGKKKQTEGDVSSIARKQDSTGLCRE